MAWTTIPNGDVDPESPITTSLITALRDNPSAIAAGSSGAPSIVKAAMGANSVGASQIEAGGVHTSELNTAVPSTTSTTTTFLSFTMTGGEYVFCPQIKTNNATYGCYIYGGDFSVDTNPFSQSTSYVTRMAIGSSNAAATATCKYRYVAASPPHDMGDGDIPLFAFVIIDNSTGDIESIATSVEPVWLANGPTNAMPAFWEKGKKYKIEKNIPPSFASLSAVERMVAISELPDVAVEITNKMVHADMDLIPHPFLDNDLSGRTVVMLDPVSSVVRQLSELDKAGEDVHEIIRNKYIKIGNTALNRVTPSGLLIPSTTWK